MPNLFIKITEEERVSLKRIVKALGFSTMTKWLKAFIQDHNKEQEAVSRAQEDTEKIAPRPLPDGEVIN